MKLTTYQKRIVNQAIGYIRESIPEKGEAISKTDLAMVLPTLRLRGKEREHFLVILLDSQNRLITDEILFSGTIDAASVYPREVVKFGLKHNAAAMILAHNHPSGECEPSQADIRITATLKTALAMVDIRVLDHIIVGSDKCTSLASRGEM